MQKIISFLIVFLSLSEIFAADLCTDWYDCVTKYRASKDTDEKISIMQEALKKWKPEHTEAYRDWNIKVIADEYYVKGRVFLDQYYRDKKPSALRQAVDIFGESIKTKEQPYVLYYRGLMYFEQKQMREAESDFTRGIALGPEEAYNYLGLSYVLLAEKKYGQLLTFLDRGAAVLGKKLNAEQKDDARSELIIFLTPHIVLAPTEMAALTVKERDRSGAAKGMTEEELNKFLDELPKKKTVPDSTPKSGKPAPLAAPKG